MKLFYQLLFLFCAVFLIGFPSLFWPLGGDQDGQLYIARALLDGQRPYVDIYDINFPLTFIFHTVIPLVFGTKHFDFRLFDLFYMFFSLSILYIFCKKNFYHSF
ncbi:MAG: hypothetical protein HQK84_09795, partial [Nitrospinae bacterium]|nr:hypothetical protein [Nitrospinota bacterium]